MDGVILKVGVIGAGAWGINHVRTLHEMGRLGAVVEMGEALRQKVEEQFPGVPVVSSLDVLWSNSELSAGIDAFVVATPAQTHADIADALFRAGKHVLVEKPMTLNTADARRILAASEAAGKTLMVGHLLLFQPAIQFIKRYLDEGKLGGIYTLTQRRSKLGRARRVENVLWSFGVHDVAVLLYLVGKAPVETRTSGHSGVTKGIEDDVHLHMRFGNGILANLHNSWLWPRVERELIITGEKGMLVYDEISQKVIFHHKRIDSELQNVDEGEEVVFEGADQPLRLELGHFIECCETGRRPIADGVNGISVVQVLENLT